MGTNQSTSRCCSVNGAADRDSISTSAWPRYMDMDDDDAEELVDLVLADDVEATVVASHGDDDDEDRLVLARAFSSSWSFWNDHDEACSMAAVMDSLG